MKAGQRHGRPIDDGARRPDVDAARESSSRFRAMLLIVGEKQTPPLPAGSDYRRRQIVGTATTGSADRSDHS
jgi:hypothetical protein